MATANTRMVVQVDPNLPAKIVVPAPKRVAELIKKNGSFSMADIRGAHKDSGVVHGTNCCQCEAEDLPTARYLRTYN